MPLPPIVFILAPFVVSFVLIAACAITELRHRRRLARITGQVLPMPPRLRVVEDAPASDPAPVISLADYKRDWYPAA